MMDYQEFEELIAARLEESGFDFEREPSVGGLRPDFLVRGPHGELVVVEAKAWHPRGGNTARALEQAERYRKATGADRVFLVLPDLKKNYESRGVVDLDTLFTALRDFFEERRRKRKRKLPAIRVPERLVFAAMPFDRKYDDTYLVAMSFAAEHINAACKRVDLTEFTGDIVEEIKRLIRSSTAVIVDLSEVKPNVLYEAGFAHALRKPTVHICSTPLDDLPFDVRNWNTLYYHRGQTTKLRKPLADRLEAILLQTE